MARKIAEVIIDKGRDKGKKFVIKEMPASQAEKWAAKAFLALARSNVDIPDNVGDMGMAGIATVGLKALSGVNFDDAEPLMDEMFSCITIMPDPSKPMVQRALIEDDIEDVSTRLFLRKEVFNLHIDFFTDAAD
jgi:hypothetical protein